MKPDQIANFRCNTNRQNMHGVTTGYKRTCTKCREHKPIAGSQRTPFVCKECRDVNSRAS